MGVPAKRLPSNMEEPKAQGTVEFLVNLISLPFSKFVLGLLVVAITLSVTAACSALSINFFQLARRYWLFWGARRKKEPGDVIVDLNSKTIKEAEVLKKDFLSQDETKNAVATLLARHKRDMRPLRTTVKGLSVSVDELQLAVIELQDEVNRLKMAKGKRKKSK